MNAISILKSDGPRFKFLPASDSDNKRMLFGSPYELPDLRTIPPRAWLYGQLLARGFITFTVAPGGVGKSALVLAEAVAMATGIPLLGSVVDSPLRVAIWNGEDPRDELARRIGAIAHHYSLDSASLGGRLYVTSGRDYPIVLGKSEYSGAVIDDDCAERIAEEIRKRQLDVLIIDPFISSHQVDENANPAIDLVLKTWSKIAEETQCAIMFVHHTRKTTGQVASVDDARGASALLAAARVVRHIQPITESEMGKFGVLKGSNIFKATIGKANMAPRSEEAEWYRITSVNLGNGPGNVGDEVGVVEKWQPVGAPSNDDRMIALGALAKARTRKDEQSPEWAGHSIAHALGWDIGGSNRAADRTAEQNSAREKVREILRLLAKENEIAFFDALDDKKIKRIFVRVVATGGFAGELAPAIVDGRADSLDRDAV